MGWGGIKDRKGPVFPWLQSVRVLDIEEFVRLQKEFPGLGHIRLSRMMGIPIAAAMNLLKGKHWQLNPEKVKAFNRFHGTSVDVATGYACAEDLKRFPSRPRNKNIVSEGRVGRNGNGEIPVDLDTDAVDRAMAAAAAGPEAVLGLPERVDAQWFLEAIDRRAALLLVRMDDKVIREMKGQQIAAAFGVLMEKRALLRGEPTQIVNYENRGKIDELAKMMMAEMKRRGIAAAEEPVVIDMVTKEVAAR